MGKTRDWKAIEVEYVAGINPHDLSAKHKVPVATIQSRASREGWAKNRKVVAAKVQAAMPDAVAAIVIDAALAAVTRHLRIWGGVLDRAEAVLVEEVPVVTDSGILKDDQGNVVTQRTVRTAGHLRDLANAIKAATEGQRLAHGLHVGKDGAGGLGKGDQPSGVIELPMLGPEPVPPPDDEGDDLAEEDAL